MYKVSLLNYSANSNASLSHHHSVERAPQQVGGHCPHGRASGRTTRRRLAAASGVGGAHGGGAHLPLCLGYRGRSKRERSIGVIASCSLVCGEACQNGCGTGIIGHTPRRREGNMALVRALHQPEETTTSCTDVEQVSPKPNRIVCRVSNTSNCGRYSFPAPRAERMVHCLRND